MFLVILLNYAEVFLGDEYTEKCDTYSFAITLWEVFTRKRPYQDMPHCFGVLWGVCNGERPSAQLLISTSSKSSFYY